MSKIKIGATVSILLFCERSGDVVNRKMGSAEIAKATNCPHTSVSYALNYLFYQFGPEVISRERDGKAMALKYLWTLKRPVTRKDFNGYPRQPYEFSKWRAEKEAEAEKKLKQAHGGFTMKDDPLVDPPGPLFDGPEKMAGLPPYVTGRGAVAALDAGITPLLQIVKAIKQSEAAILCHMDKMDERELKRFRILEEKLAHIASTAERWAEIESRLGKLALSAGRIPALESKVAILTEEIRKARREVGFMNPKLDKLCKEWGVKP